jgi:hypothetical protein
MVLGILATMAGILYLFAGLRMMNIVVFGPMELGDGVWLAGLLTFIVGVIWVGVGGALWALQPWGLMFAQIMAVFSLMSAVFTILFTYNSGLGSAILAAVLLWYTTREQTVAAFTGTGVRTS